jgi:uncharacterized Fe-S center protein
MADGLTGDCEISVPIKGKLFSEVAIAREIRMADVLIVLSHMTGHLCTGFGATLKNLGMGMASRKGKLRQHSQMTPVIDESCCTGCMKCRNWCPEDAISQIFLDDNIPNNTEITRKAHNTVNPLKQIESVPDGNHLPRAMTRQKVAKIDKEKCIGCGECLAVCRHDAVLYDWNADNNWLQKAIAEHALGAVKGKKAFYINYCCNMTKLCDCIGKEQQAIIKDVGILASTDPVALDTASLDLCHNSEDMDLAAVAQDKIDGRIQLVHAQAIGLGSMVYNIINV